MRSLRTQEDIMATWQGNPDKPVVSICCITYNHESYIEDALEGFLIQETDFPFEILIHDDASTDRTADIIREYEAKYPKLIKPIYQVDNQYSRGVRVNPVFNLSRVRGHYVAMCEGDDYWTAPNKLQLQLQLLEKEPNIGLCIHQTLQLNVTSGSQVKHTDFGDKQKVLNVNDALLSGKQFAATSSYFFRFSFYKSIPYWMTNERLPYGDFFMECVLGRDGILYTPRLMSTYRRGVEGSHTLRMRDKKIDELKSEYMLTVNCTKRLDDLDWIKSDALAKRLDFVHMEYALRFMRRDSYGDFKNAVENIKFPFFWKGYLLVLSAKTRIIYEMLRNIYKLKSNT